MTTIGEVPQKNTLPNDIIQEIIDILAATNPPSPTPTIPATPRFEDENNIDDVEWSLSPDETDIPPGRQYVKPFSSLSSFCLRQARKHIFAHVVMTSQDVYAYVPRNPPPKRLPTLHSQVDFFRQHKETLPYIRNLSITVTQDEMDDVLLQAQLHSMLTKLENLTALTIQSHGIWTRLSPDSNSRSMRSALRVLLQSQTLSKLCVNWLQDFDLGELSKSANLCTLNLYNTRPDMETTGLNDVELGKVRELSITGYRPFMIRKFEALKAALVAMNDEGRLRVKFGKVKGLCFDVYESLYFAGILEIVTAHASDTLEDLELRMFLDSEDGNNDHSAWLDRIITHRSGSLRKLSLYTWVANEDQDPFSGICSTLKRMDSHNVLEALEVTVTVQTDSPCAPGDVWVAFGSVFEGSRKWPQLKKVMLKVLVADCGREDNSLQCMLRGLRETGFKHMFSKPFDFEYVVQTMIV
ncbi:hypothetical protein CVT24_005891 [Panaeolus cyanescens]|uniref:F-box domain-containing protein n=1 Tax=Panaeolus cyanescens TaxID=181874 RepID=A0A409WH02_9AGAR|nr:hypothetical protein CVT24_005891 [Panaeolus cyanescens]